MEIVAALVWISARELTLAAAVGILVFGLDDLMVDALYIGRRLWRRATIYSRFPRASTRSLMPPAQPGRFALLVPAWDEGNVIGDMLRGTLDRLEHEDYLIFVGAYSNDPATAAAVAGISDSRARLVTVPHPGPTTKADCLNSLWAAMLEEEAAVGRRFKAIVLHDAEDIVHSAELRLFEPLIERFALVQLPVLPLPDPHSPWIAGSYLDEFAESHGKDLVVREAMNAAVPSAGVGCAIARDMMDRVAVLNGGQPFDQAALTEDYELGLKIGKLGGRSALVRLPCGDRRVVATREHFPATLGAAVRQKSRWLTGIALAGWDRLGWNGSLSERWWRMRDRKSVAAALVTLIAYAALVMTALNSLIALRSNAPSLPPIVSSGSLLAWLVTFSTMMLVWRLAMRVIFTTRSYGLLQGALAIPRAVVSNIIAILACLRAIGRFTRGWHTNAPPIWEKTSHVFPAVLPAE